MDEILKVIMSVMQFAGRLQLDIEVMPNGKWKISVVIDPSDIIKKA
jgi:hypothetical protein